MSYLKSCSIKKPEGKMSLLKIDAFKHSSHLLFDPGLNVIMGENGCGKSSLLEAWGLQMHLAQMDDRMDWDDSFEIAKSAQPYLQINFHKKPKSGFFFRVEDFSKYINTVQQEKGRLYDDLGDLPKKYKGRVIDEMNESRNYLLQRMRRKYGDNLATLSHGNACLAILEVGMQSGGVILLDEPEQGLHPIYLTKLIDTIREKAQLPDHQFIIATHSPLIASIPGAALYEIQPDGIKRLAYQETDHYKITRAYMDGIDRLIDRPP
jgi:predicted ATPase